MEYGLQIGTEVYIQNEEAKMVLWTKQYGGELQEAITLVDNAFSTKEKSYIDKLVALYNDETLVNALCENTEFAFLVVVMTIYNAEEESGISNGVFDWVDSFKSAIDVIRQIKFLLWEIEFLDVKESVSLLLGYKSDIGISVPALEYLIHISCCDKAKVVNVINSLL